MPFDEIKSESRTYLRARARDTSARCACDGHSFSSTTMRALPPRPLPRILLLGLVPIAAWFIVRPLLDPVPSLPALYTSVGFSIFAFLATIYLIPALGPSFVKAGLKGGDLLKPYRYEIPMSV